MNAKTACENTSKFFCQGEVASGADHIALLTQSGSLYSLGNSERGPLGNVPELFAFRGGQKGLNILLTPAN
jgi:regulator of chromosome condensation